MEPLQITVAKADPTGPDPIRSAVLHIAGELPQFVGAEATWRRAAIAAYKGDAARIVRALNSLPQGTLDRLLMLLLERRASLLRVPVLTEEPHGDAELWARAVKLGATLPCGHPLAGLLLVPPNGSACRACLDSFENVEVAP